MKNEHPLKAIRRAGVPLVAFETADPAQTIRGCVASLNGKSADVPIVTWDICNGLSGLNKAGTQAVAWYDPLVQQLPDILKELAVPGKVPKGTLCFFHNVGKFIERDGVAQGIWNLRDAFKASEKTLVMVGATLTLPPELGSDVIVVSENPPGRIEITEIVKSLVSSAKLAGAAFSDDYEPSKVVDGLTGLASAFDVEQTVSLSIGREGIDMPGVWTRKIARLKATTGAEIAIDNPDFSRLAGCANVKGELLGFINGRQRPGVVLFQDEIEKMFGGAGTDLSGVTTNMLGQWLTWTAERKVRGFLLAGIPGAGKTWTGTCTAGQANVPFFKLSLSETKGSLVGQSEQQLKSALKAVDALAGDGSVLMIASCNWVDNLTPDVMGRFTMGTFFYDYPDDEERLTLWAMYMRRFELPDQPIPDSVGWVGREIENCCWRAWQYRRSLVEVAANISPSCISQRAKLEQLRNSCSGRFLSASQPGFFEVSKVPAPEVGKRVMKF